MIMWNETRLLPDINTTHVLDGCENTCESCEEWGEKCETCNVSVPIVCDSGLHAEQVTMAQMTICGIPVGSPYEVSRDRKEALTLH